MKKIISVLMIVFLSAMLYAQDIITLKTGETIEGKVAEVGVTEIKYYKSSNINGPIYVTGKADVAQISYHNGTKDVFAGGTSSPQPSMSAMPQNAIVVPQNAQVIVVERPVRRGWPYIPYGIIVPHIDFRHHYSFGHHNMPHFGRGHH